MKIHKTILTFAAIAALPFSAFATGLSFQTLAPTVGDILQADDSTAISLAASVTFGTVAGDAGTFTSFADYTGAFATLATGALSAGAVTEVTGSIVSGSLAGGVDLWMLVTDTNGANGAFYLGATPGLGFLVGTPSTAVAGAGGTWSATGSNVQLSAVPEPSTFAALAGLCALSFVMVRRRRA
tara:strand:+ start:447 stop:995 length:549 start_codon:yes stop_codon:yes gene_type:complete